MIGPAIHGTIYLLKMGLSGYYNSANS